LPGAAFARRRVWLNLVILGLASPLVNSLYNYVGGLFRENDVGRLLKILLGAPVHLYFLATLGGYAIGLIAVFRRGRTACAR
jgi:hypothetical protein